MKADYVPMPTSADEAAMMCLIGEAWLRENAPERLRAAQQEAQEAVAWMTPGYPQIVTDEWKRENIDKYPWVKEYTTPLYACPPRAVEPMPALTDERIKHLWDKACRTVTVQGGGNDVLVFADYLTRELRGIGKQGQG